MNRSYITEIVLCLLDLKHFIFLMQKVKSWSDNPNVMTPCWVTDSFEFARVWSNRDEVFKVDLAGLFISWDRPKAKHISK